MKTLNSKAYLYSAAAAAILIVGLLSYFFFAGFSACEETRYVYIDDDDNQDSVFVKLQPIGKAAGLSGLQTLARHWHYEDHIRTGRYAIEPGESALTVFRHLKNGQQSPVNLTIPESRTMDRMAGTLAHRLMLDSATIAQALTDSAYCARLGYDTCTIAALFVPNTYEVYWNIGLDALMERMIREHDVFWNGSRTQKAQQTGLTPIEVATLASIIDEETANTAEKPMIAGMYLNRLKLDMPLQADPTIKFALKQFELRRIYNKQLNTNSPYNTYRNTGLPPGPIKVASIKGIDAVLNYVHHDYLYMCAKEDFSGSHNFAQTYQEHLANAAKYTRALNQRNIR